MKNLISRLSGFSGLFLLVLSVSNFYLAFRAASVVNLKSVTVTNVVEIAALPSSVSTNDLPPSAVFPPPQSSAPSAPVAPVQLPREVAQWPYRYFLVNRRIGLEAFGRYYYEGSPCSYGRIWQIYPDRILLVGGDWISNRIEREVASNKELKK